MEHQYRFDLSPRLHYRASRVVGSRSRARKVFNGALLSLPVLFVLLALVRGWSLLGALREALFWIIFAPLATFIIFPWLQRWQIARYFAKAPSLRGEQTFEFNDS